MLDRNVSNKILLVLVWHYVKNLSCDERKLDRKYITFSVWLRCRWNGECWRHCDVIYGLILILTLTLAWHAYMIHCSYIAGRKAAWKTVCFAVTTSQSLEYIAIACRLHRWTPRANLAAFIRYCYIVFFCFDEWIYPILAVINISAYCQFITDKI